MSWWRARAPRPSQARLSAHPEPNTGTPSRVARRPPGGFAALVFALAFVFGGWTEAGDPRIDGDTPPSQRLVAIGDIHGAYNGFRSILREVSLIDDKDRWIGSDTILVQTGDFLDRGPGATRVARLLMDLQEQAVSW